MIASIEATSAGLAGGADASTGAGAAACCGGGLALGRGALAQAA